MMYNRPWLIKHNLPEPFSRRVEGFQTGFTMFPNRASLEWNSSVCENSLEPIQVLCLCSFACLLKQGHQNIADQARHVRNKVSALPDTRDKLARVQFRYLVRAISLLEHRICDVRDTKWDIQQNLVLQPSASHSPLGCLQNYGDHHFNPQSTLAGSRGPQGGHLVRKLLVLRDQPRSELSPKTGALI